MAGEVLVVGRGGEMAGFEVSINARIWVSTEALPTRLLTPLQASVEWPCARISRA